MARPHLVPLPDGDGLPDIIGHNLEPDKIFVWHNLGNKSQPRFLFKQRSVYEIHPVWGVYGYNRDTRQHDYDFDIADWDGDSDYDMLIG